MDISEPPVQRRVRRNTGPTQSSTRRHSIKDSDPTSSEAMEEQPMSAQTLLPKPPPTGILKYPFRLPPTDLLKPRLERGNTLLFERTHPLFHYIRALESENFHFLFTCHDVAGPDGTSRTTDVRYQPQFLQDKGVEFVPVEIKPDEDLRGLLYERHGPGIWYGMVGFQRLRFPLDIVLTRLDNFVLPEEYRTWRM